MKTVEKTKKKLRLPNYLRGKMIAPFLTVVLSGQIIYSACFNTG